ncbi:MAG: GGDEF domain-containing protein [Candidatus Omnitrophica bacterium]|nr:GGDEF domain-containing protein [Candidatus Omnitrophota bacterium]MDD5430475.1 GGDEF domain-containing protein [Candidatus Omnitrophota bacterium]
MFFLIAGFILFAGFLFNEFFLLKRFRRKEANREHSLAEDVRILEKRGEDINNEVKKWENILSERFSFYDITRKITPYLDKEELARAFIGEMKYLNGVESVEFYGSSRRKGWLTFKLKSFEQDYICIKTTSHEVIECLPYFIKLFILCLERIDLYRKLQELSIHDSLTGIYNRRYFMQRFAEEFQRAKQFNLNLAFLMIDIDNFKKINDTYGHLVGDVVLREVAVVIKESTREIDFLARFGGEEFSAVLLETGKDEAVGAGKRINERVIQKKIHAFDEILSVSVSIGVACFPQNALYPDVLLEVADKAMYQAKLSGRNRVCFF